MSVKVIVREGEPLQAALVRFRTVVRLAYRRQFYKTRVGCYEKPSDRRRRARRAGERNARVGHPMATVYIGLSGLYSRDEDPFRS